MSLRKVLVSMLCALCAVSLLVPAALAHGWHGGGRRQAQMIRPCALCPVEGCELAGRHEHNGVTYCGFQHANGWCDGTCAPLCPVEGCTLTGRHYHDGAVYCGANHAAGWCDGSCGCRQLPGSRGGHCCCGR